MLQKNTGKKSIPGLAEYTEKMVAALAHEIRNPLNSMKGAAEYLYEKYTATPEVKEFSGIILSEINRVDNYLSEFLSFSRGIKLKITRVNMKSFITGIIMTVKHGFLQEIITVIDRADFFIDIDTEQMRQVMVNLLWNARDAVKASGRAVPEVTIKAFMKGNKAIIEVSDNGIGIKKAMLKNIFVPFFTTKADGMGIGLSICRAVVQRHRGRIKVKTSPGKGSAFRVELPLKRKKDKNV